VYRGDRRREGAAWDARFLLALEEVLLALEEDDLAYPGRGSCLPWRRTTLLALEEGPGFDRVLSGWPCLPWRRAL
jgi:hypothetical protein